MASGFPAATPGFSPALLAPPRPTAPVVSLLTARPSPSSHRCSSAARTVISPAPPSRSSRRAAPPLPPVDLFPILPDGSPDLCPAPAGRPTMFADTWDSLIGDTFCSSLLRHGVVPDLFGTPPARRPRSRTVPASPTPSQRAQVELVRKLHEERVIEALESGIPPPDSSPCSASIRRSGVVARTVSTLCTDHSTLGWTWLLRLSIFL